MALGRTIATIIGEAIVLAGIFSGLALASFAFFHAGSGAAVLFAADGMALETAHSTPLRLVEPKRLETLPAQTFIRVPFVAQAPRGEWIEPWKEACEEASVLMAMGWLWGETSITPAHATSEMLAQIKFELRQFGYYQDTAARETTKIITQHYNYGYARVVYDIGIDDVRREIAIGNIVILPVAVTVLSNPNDRSDPPYHMIVAVGYDDVAREFIVNDPGTQKGEGYRYPYSTVEAAIHDWIGRDENVLEGQPAMIVISRPPA